MKNRKLRIAWTAFWGIAAVLVIALWAHTLHRQVRLQLWLTNSLYVRSVALKHWAELEPSFYAIDPPSNWYPRSTFQDNPVDAKQEAVASPVRRWRCSTDSSPDFSVVAVTVPFWFLTLLTAFVGVTPWAAMLPGLKRFSLRTLLIAITLIGLGLGTVLWLSR